MTGAALVLLAGCETAEFGFSGRDAEWSRGDFAVVSASAERAVVSARGRQVAVEPPPGFCLAQDSLETSGRSAFVLIGDCVLEGGAGGVRGADGGLDLPAGMPGIITVSISGDPGFSRRGASEADMSELEGYLGSAEGRALLGRGGDGSQVSVIETRRQGDILYVLVEDREGEAVPVLAPRFWRAFVVLNDRLAVVTVSGFREVPMDEGQMLRHLGDQVRQLQVANAAPVDDAPIQVAMAAPRPRPAETGSGDAVAEDGDVAGIEVVEAAAVEGGAEVTALADAAVAADGALRDDARLALDDMPPGASLGDAVPPDPAWAALALSDATAVRDAPPAPDDGWQALDAAEAEMDVLAARGAVRPQETVTGWPEPTEATDTEIADPPDVPPAGRADEPVVIAAAGFGRQAVWPMPPARPGADGTAAAVPQPRPEQGAVSGVLMPTPMPRLLNPAEQVAGSMPPAAAAPQVPRENGTASATPMPTPRQIDQTAPIAGSPPPAAAVPLPPRARR